MSKTKARIPEDKCEDASVIEHIYPLHWEREKDCIKYPISQHVCTNNLSNKHQSFMIVIDAKEFLTSVQEAMEKEYWTQVIREETNALKRNTTQKIVDKPRDKKGYG